jgi:hypothetical protein
MPLRKPLKIMIPGAVLLIPLSLSLLFTKAGLQRAINPFRVNTALVGLEYVY